MGRLVIKRSLLSSRTLLYYMRGINPTMFNLCLCVKVGHARSPLIIQELYSWEVISEDARSAYVTDKKERDYKFHFILLIIEYHILK